MIFQPAVGQELIIREVAYRVTEHPSAPGMPYGQEGRQAVVYQLAAGTARSALKVFKARYRTPALVGLTRRIAPFADLTGLTVCRRTVLTPQQHGTLLRQEPDLTYAVLMPWIAGPTWLEVLLGGQALTPAQSLALARALAGVLAEMEQDGLAHGDLSGPNLLLPVLADPPGPPPSAAVELVDVEQLYAPGLPRPETIPAGSPGYAHHTASEGLWGATADRFAGAVLLVEMLGWADARVRAVAWGESYFDPAETQQPGPRFDTLVQVLTARWGAPVAHLFERAWGSETLADCPTFGEWLVALPEEVPVSDAPPDARPPAAPPEPPTAPDSAVHALRNLAAEFATQGNIGAALTTYRRALALVPADSGLAREITRRMQTLDVPVQPAHQPIALPPRPSGQPGAAEPSSTSPTPAMTPVAATARPRDLLGPWFVAALLSWIGGLLLFTITLPLMNHATGDLPFAITAGGLFAGTVQWLALQHARRTSLWWIPATGLGWLTGLIAAFVLTQALAAFSISPLFFLFLGGGTGLAAGLGQGYLLGARLRSLPLYMLFAVLGYGTAWGLYGAAARYSIDLDVVITSAGLAGVALASITTAGWYIALRNRPTLSPFWRWLAATALAMFAIQCLDAYLIPRIQESWRETLNPGGILYWSGKTEYLWKSGELFLDVALGLLYGGLLGTAQWRALRGHHRLGRAWIVITAVSLVAANLAMSLILDVEWAGDVSRGGGWLPSSINGGVTGLLLGLGQWWLLRRDTTKTAVLWIPATTLGALLGSVGASLSFVLYQIQGYLRGWQDHLYTGVVASGFLIFSYREPPPRLEVFSLMRWLNEVIITSLILGLGLGLCTAVVLSWLFRFPTTQQEAVQVETPAINETGESAGVA